MGTTNLAEVLQIDGDIEHKDGPPGGLELTSIIIDIAVNGYSVEFVYEDLTSEKYVFEDMDDVLKMIRSKH